jgi:hypothetical protein
MNDTGSFVFPVSGTVKLVTTLLQSQELGQPVVVVGAGVSPNTCPKAIFRTGFFF